MQKLDAEHEPNRDWLITALSDLERAEVIRQVESLYSDEGDDVPLQVRLVIQWWMIEAILADRQQRNDPCHADWAGAWYEDAGLSTRAFKCAAVLESEGYTTPSEVAEAGYDRLMRVPNAGATTVNEIAHVLKDAGFRLKGWKGWSSNAKA